MDEHFSVRLSYDLGLKIDIPTGSCDDDFTTLPQSVSSLSKKSGIEWQHAKNLWAMGKYLWDLTYYTQSF